jgi:hypothetical protein
LFTNHFQKKEEDKLDFSRTDKQPVRLADGWCWFVVRLVLVCSERKILLAGCWWLVCSERKVPLAGG